MNKTVTHESMEQYGKEQGTGAIQSSGKQPGDERCEWCGSISSGYLHECLTSSFLPFGD